MTKIAKVTKSLKSELSNLNGWLSNIAAVWGVNPTRPMMVPDSLASARPAPKVVRAKAPRPVKVAPVEPEPEALDDELLPTEKLGPIGRQLRIMAVRETAAVLCVARPELARNIKAFVRCRMDGGSYSEVAREEGVGTSTVASWAHRGFKLLLKEGSASVKIWCEELRTAKPKTPPSQKDLHDQRKRAARHRKLMRLQRASGLGVSSVMANIG